MKLPVLFLVLVLYGICIGTLLYTRPALMFDGHGRPKTFGVGFNDGYSVFAPSVAFPLLALLLYIFVAWLRLFLG